MKLTLRIAIDTAISILVLYYRLCTAEKSFFILLESESEVCFVGQHLKTPDNPENPHIVIIAYGNGNKHGKQGILVRESRIGMFKPKKYLTNLTHKIHTIRYP